MNQWFYNTFLPSIFERCEAGKGRWLSGKQTAICIGNMERSTVRFDSDGYGTMWNHDNYTCEWNGRSVHLSYSKKNGCGCIEFGFNSEEIASMKAEHEREQQRLKAERIIRIKNSPERLAKKIAALTKNIHVWEEEYCLDLAEGDEEQARQDLQMIQELKEELKLYT